MLDGVRNQPPVGRAAIADSFVALSDLAADADDLIAELDVDPLPVTGTGCVALDALVVPQAAIAAASAELADPSPSR